MDEIMKTLLFQMLISMSSLINVQSKSSQNLNSMSDTIFIRWTHFFRRKTTVISDKNKELHRFFFLECLKFIRIRKMKIIWKFHQGMTCVMNLMITTRKIRVSHTFTRIEGRDFSKIVFIESPNAFRFTLR